MSTTKPTITRRTALGALGSAVVAACAPRQRTRRSTPDARYELGPDSVATRLTRSYAIEHPVVQAGMGFVATPALAAAVSNAGGLGILGASPEPPPGVAEMIRQCRALTARPFGVDLVNATTALGPACTDAHVDACVEGRVGLVVFHWDTPRREWIDALHAAGSRVWMQTGLLDVARAAIDAGVDGLVAQGQEAGGHVKSDHDGLALVAALRRDHGDEVLVLAAGGIVDGADVARALDGGADGAWIGTRFLASAEADAHDEYKRRIVAARGADATVITTLFGPEWPDEPTRVLRNRVVDQWSGREAEAPRSTEPIGKTVLFPFSNKVPYDMPRYSAAVPTRATVGDFDEMALGAGTGASRIGAVEPAAVILLRIAKETRVALGG